MLQQPNRKSAIITCLHRNVLNSDHHHHHEAPFNDSLTALSLRLPPQQSHQEHDVVRSAGDQRAGAEDLQEPGAASSAGGEAHSQTDRQGSEGPAMENTALAAALCPILNPSQPLLCLQCDGVPMSLPSLQGLAVLNIPSYAGGINFWGGTKEDNVSVLDHIHPDLQLRSSDPDRARLSGKHSFCINADRNSLLSPPLFRTLVLRPLTIRSWRWLPCSGACRWPCPG